MALTSAVEAGDTLSTEDIVVVVLYFVAIIGIGLYASCRSARGTVSGYFLAGREMRFFMVGASLFVSNIGSEHFIGLAGSGAAGGIGVGAWEFNAILLLQLLGFVFLPVYIASRLYTMPEYLTKRFGGRRIKVYFAVLSLVLYIFTKCSVDLYTGALFIQQSLGWDLYLSILVLIIIVAVLTITGGLTAVIYTDTLQAFLMVVGACVLTILAFVDVGGFEGLWRKYPESMTNLTVPNTSCHLPSDKWDVMLRGADDPDMPWAGFLFGQTPGSIWYWCADQVIVQRALAAKSLSHAQGATIMAGFIKVLPLFVMVFPGMIARVKYPDSVACVDPAVCEAVCQSRAGCTNIAYPRLVLGIMPAGARGLMMAVMIAALMSDLDSIFNSASTLFTIDIWKTVRAKCSVKEQLIVGRIFVLVMTGVSIAWVPVVKETQGGQVFIYIQEITNYFAPAVAATFLIAILWPRCNEKGAFWGLMAGLVTGLTRLVLVFVYRPPGFCGDEDTRPAILRDFQYMYFAMFLFWQTVVVSVVVSLLTEPPEPHLLWRTTFWTRHEDRSYEDALKGYKTTEYTQTYDNPGLEASHNDVDVTVPAEQDTKAPDGATDDAQATSSAPTEEMATAEPAAGSKQTEGNAPSAKSGTAPTSGLTRQNTSSEWTEKLLNFFCGFDSKGIDEEANRKAEEKANKISSLKQNPTAKAVLYTMLVVVLSLGTALYLFWSLWKYTPPPLPSKEAGTTEL